MIKESLQANSQQQPKNTKTKPTIRTGHLPDNESYCLTLVKLDRLFIQQIHKCALSAPRIKR